MHPHDIVGNTTFKMLPEWEKKLWSKQAPFIGQYSFIPDTYHRDKNLEKYVRLPNGMTIPHGPAKKDGEFAVFQKEYSEELTCYIIKYYFKKIVDLLRKENHREAARFAGTLAHYIQDSSTPGHIVGNYLLGELMPFPKGIYFNMHKLFDVFDVKEKDLVGNNPQLLGTSVTEAVYRTCIEYKKMLARAKGMIIPCIQQVYKGNMDRRDFYMRNCAKLAANLTSSVWHTAFCIAYKSFSQKEKEALEKLDLTSILPDIYYSQAPYFSYVPNIMAQDNGKTQSLKLFTEKNSKKIIKNGFAVSGSSVVVYEFPKGLYNNFSVTLGLHSDMPTRDRAGFRIAVEKSRKDRVEIEGNLHQIKMPKVPKWVSINEWKSNKYLLFDSGPVSVKKPLKIVIELPACHRLLLLTYKVNNKQTQSIWANGVLMK